MITPDDIAVAQQMQLDAMWDRCIIRQADSWAGEVLTPGAIAWQHDGQDMIPCRIASAGGDMAGVGGSTAGGQGLTVTSVMVTLPVGCRPTHGQVITIVTARIDPLIAGHRFVVDASQGHTFLTARRVVARLID